MGYTRACAQVYICRRMRGKWGGEEGGVSHKVINICPWFTYAKSIVVTC